MVWESNTLRMGAVSVNVCVKLDNCVATRYAPLSAPKSLTRYERRLSTAGISPMKCDWWLYKANPEREESSMMVDIDLKRMVENSIVLAQEFQA